MRTSSYAWAVAVGLIAGRAAAEPSAFAVRAIGTPAVELMSPKRPVFALVSLPAEEDPVRLGLRPVVPGLAVLHGDAARVAGFAQAHPEADVELHPPLRPKLDGARAFVGLPASTLGSTLEGLGSIVGIVDTGVDVAHRDFRNEDGTTRIAYFLDFATAPRPDVEIDQAYGGRVWTRLELDGLLAGTLLGAPPGDADGHGTHVAGIAAGNGGPSRRFVGVAPKADLIVVRVSSADGSVDEAAAVLGTKFVFDRAKALGKPASVNLSLGTQYGAHDGTSKFERGLSELAKGAGRAVVVAASNEGALPIHTSVRVTPGATFRIPIELLGADGRGRAYKSGAVYVWVNKRDRGDLRVGLRAPDGGVWLEPVGPGRAFEARPSSNLRALVANEVPSFLDGGETSGAIAILSGALPVGRFELELEGDGATEIWLQGTNEAIDGPGMPLFPRGAQVEGSIGVPASAAGVISVGCVAARASFGNMKGDIVSIDGAALGERCSFSSVGPAAQGHARPDLLAPGYYVISSLARAAYLASPAGNFGTAQLVDTEHAALAGTSMSSPFVAGAAALLFQADPSLDQEDVRALLMAGARPLADDPKEGGSPRDPGKGAGILDVGGALSALERRASPPPATQLMLRLGATWLAADGQLPLYGLVQATDANGKPADVPGGLSLEADNARVRDALSHPAVGLYRFSIVAAPGKGLEKATIRLRGALGLERAVSIGADRWDARDGMRSGGGCAFGARSDAPWATLALLGLAALRHRARRRARAAHDGSSAR